MFAMEVGGAAAIDVEMVEIDTRVGCILGKEEDFRTLMKRIAIIDTTSSYYQLVMQLTSPEYLQVIRSHLKDHSDIEEKAFYDQQGDNQQWKYPFEVANDGLIRFVKANWTENSDFLNPYTVRDVQTGHTINKLEIMFNCCDQETIDEDEDDESDFLDLFIKPLVITSNSYYVGKVDLKCEKKANMLYSEEEHRNSCQIGRLTSELEWDPNFFGRLTSELEWDPTFLSCKK